MRDGSFRYLIKWCETTYAECTWEDEDMDIPEFATHISNYEDLKYARSIDADVRNNKKGKKKGRKVGVTRFSQIW